MCASIWVANPGAEGKQEVEMRCRPSAVITFHGPQLEHTCWDPKDGELCLRRAKPGEILVEARSRSDVQIDGRTWV